MIDLIFLLLAPAHPAWVALAILQAVARRSPYIVAGLLLLPALVGLSPIDPARPWVLRVLPGAAKIMSNGTEDAGGSDLVRNQAEPGEPGAVRAHQNQVEPSEPVKNEPDPQDQNGPVQARSGDDPTIAYLAQLRKADGSYRFSANDILKLVGGTAAEVKRQIASYRQDAPRVATSIRRPDGGW